MKLFYFPLIFLVLFTVVASAQNEQLMYDGADDFCNVPGGEVLFSNLDVFTFETWLKTSDYSNSPIFMGSSSGEILFGITSTGSVAFGTSFMSGGTLVVALAGTLPADGMWHHIACVRTGTGAGQGKIYIDGVDQTDPTVNTTGATVTLSGDLSLGVGLTTYFLNGAMDDLRIWNVARTQTQINNFKDVQLSGNESGLIGYWQFNEGSGQTILDSQTNGTTHDGTLGLDGNVASDDPTRIQDPGLPLPVELVSFTSNVHNYQVELSWITASEVNNMGFDIEKKPENGTYQKIGFVSGNGTSAEFHNYTFTDIVSQPGKYYYRLKQIDFDGSFKYSNEVIAEVTSVPLTFSLEQNYPNPFNPSTTISYTLPGEGFINLSVYNSIGEKITELINESQESGKHKMVFNASDLSSGIYIYKLNFKSVNGDYNSSKLMSLIK